MCEGFIKFPRTPHLVWPIDRPPKDDRVLSAAESVQFLLGTVIVEEKVDGANIGLSLDAEGTIRAQNRGAWIERGAHPQFQPLWAWIGDKHSVLTEILRPDRILFGEWCFAVHSVRYDRLPDWFLAFDVFDCLAGRFWSTARRDRLLEASGICRVPLLSAGHTSLATLQEILQSEVSRVGSHGLEGLYVRRDTAEWLEGRAKLVRSEFLLAIDEHWSSRSLERNKIIAKMDRVGYLA
jgi:ATP-dependent RNA circularization protein (DNA/RNA ligase family)